MIRDLPEDKFEKLSAEGKKRYIVELIIKESKASPVPEGLPPVAIIMAGIPGAGKTEFLEQITEDLEAETQRGEFVRIDLDQIVTIYPGYTPKTYAKFRSQGNNVLARCIDVLRRQRYNMMIDGTFSGTSGSSVNNVEKLLKAGYRVVMVYMYDRPEIAWKYTKLREKETDRGIDKAGFIESCNNISTNIKEALLKFRSNPNYSLAIIKQKVLRDKDYDFVISAKEIDKIVGEGYNIDKLKETL